MTKEQIDRVSNFIEGAKLWCLYVFPKVGGDDEAAAYANWQAWGTKKDAYTIDRAITLANVMLEHLDDSDELDEE